MTPLTQRALRFAINSLLAKRQSEQEMRERLEKRYPEADREQIITRLKELEYLDDDAYCEAYIRYRSSSAPRGAFSLKRELNKKGIASETVQHALSEFSEEEYVFELAAQKWQKLHRSPFQKRKEQLMRFLASRGFQASLVIDAVNHVAESPDE